MRFNAPRHSFQQQTPVAEKIKATVKWFDPNKGFGFVAPEDGSPDAFLPASAVTAVGHDRLPEGTTVVVDLVQSQKGNQVSRIYDVDVSTASPRPRRDDAPRPGPRPGASAAPRSPYGNDRGGYGGGNDRGYGNDRGGTAMTVAATAAATTAAATATIAAATAAAAVTAVATTVATAAAAVMVAVTTVASAAAPPKRSKAPSSGSTPPRASASSPRQWRQGRFRPRHRRRAFWRRSAG